MDHRFRAMFVNSLTGFKSVALIGAKSLKGEKSHVQIGMYFKEQIHIPLNDIVLLIGEVRDVNISESILEGNGYLNIEKAGTISCCGLV